MKPIDVVVLTDHRYIAPKETNEYINNVLQEDQLVVDALNNLEINTIRLAWDNSNFDWSTTKYIIFRTTWDYFDRYTEFSAWLQEVSKKTTLFNSAYIIKWNIDKHYLADLEAKDVAIVPTYFIEKGETKSLNEIYKSLSWQKIVLKPCISGAARHTYKINVDTIADHEAIFKTLIAEEAMMIQPFLENIVTQGEVSMIVIDGTYTHAILKKAKAGDFRVQDDFGGSVHEYIPTQEEIDFAENAVKACIEMPIYARVDIVKDNNNAWAISELELIEPELWFRHHHGAATALAKAVQKRMQ